MVATLEVVFLVLFVLLGLWWFSRTTLFRAHMRSGADPRGKGDDFGFGKRSPRITSADSRMRPPTVRHYDDK
jgi:hypothetical protein